MTTAINALVTSLGDFPLDPDSGKAWLWSGTGERLLWVSETAHSAIGSVTQDNNPSQGAPAFLRSFAPLLDLPSPDREPIRVQQLTLGGTTATSVVTCLCRHVPLIVGGYGLLAVAIGAPARSLAAMQEISQAASQEALQTQSQAEKLAESAPVAMPQPVTAAPVTLPPVEAPVRPPAPLAIKATEPVRAMPVEDARLEKPSQDELRSVVSTASRQGPHWLAVADSERRPARFVWQTDRDGRFVHLSRELADIVGPQKAALLGKTWQELAASIDVLETDGVSKGLASGETWNAAPVLWPVENSTLGVPVEMAGIKVVEAGVFAGFRGYGIARIERAVERPASAADAIAQDTIPETEEPEDRFGPAALRALRMAPKPLPITPPETPSVNKPAPVAPPMVPEAPRLDTPRTSDIVEALDGTKIPETPQTNDLPQNDLPQSGIQAEASTTRGSLTPDGSSLTSAERETFREIARALGAKDNAVSPPTKPAEDQPKARRWLQSNKRPLDLLKQDLLMLASEAPSQEKAAPTSDERPAAPIISIGDFQARRDQKSKQDSSTHNPLFAAGPQILEKAPVGLLVMQDGKVVFANRFLLDLVRCPDLATFLSDGGAERLFVPSDRDLTSAAGNFKITTRDGENVPVEATIQAITWDDAPATLTSLRKPSVAPVDHKEKELELDLLSTRAELKELRSILDTATDGVILLDGKGQILSLNRSAEALFGFDQKEIAGESFTILLEPESHLSALDYLEGLKTNGVKSILNDGRDVRGRERNGGTIPLFMTIGRVGEKYGSARFCAVLRDITHWKKVEGELLEAKRNAETSSDNKTDFLARISHEIRTPLNAIIGFAEVMKTEQFGPIGNERYKQYSRDIHASGVHIVSLVNDLLDLSKVAAGKLELSFGSVDINALVAASVAMIQPQANAGKVIVRSQLATNLPPVVADERSIRQIMLNLLSNAAKFTEAGGQVVASTSFTDKGEVVIRIRDTGIGMSPDDVKKAMEPFRQITGPRSMGGTGLGLPLTKALVEANRAGFSMESEPRKGTLVEIMFPSTRVLAE